MLSDKRSYLRPIITTMLVDWIRASTTQVVKESILPHLKLDLDKGWSDCTPDRLMLVLALRKKDKVCIFIASVNLCVSFL